MPPELSAGGILHGPVGGCQGARLEHRLWKVAVHRPQRTVGFGPTFVPGGCARAP